MAESLTTALAAWRDGDRRGLDHVFPLIYDELRRRAAIAFRREPGDHTLRPTEVVHEVYLRLGRQLRAPGSRDQLLAVAALLMRRILVEHARRRGARRREARVTLTDGVLVPARPEVELAALTEALAALERDDPPALQVVLLRSLAGMSEEEIAETLGVSPRTVRRRWRFGRAYLNRLLTPAEGA